MSLITKVPSIPYMNIRHNVGGMFDIPNGAYHIGSRGESILNGGIPPFTAVLGPEHSYKSTLLAFLEMSILNRLPSFKQFDYDSEETRSYQRAQDLSQRFPNLKDVPHGDSRLTEDEIRFILTARSARKTELFVEEFLDDVLEDGRERTKGTFKTLTTPFLNPDGTNIKIIPPIGVALDSISKAMTRAVSEGIVDKTVVGDSKENMLNMTLGRHKDNLISRMAASALRYGIIYFVSAHTGDDYAEMKGMYEAKDYTLANAKKGVKVKGASPNILKLPNLVLEIFDVKTFKAKDYKDGVMYPLDATDRHEDSKDLMEATIVITRSKDGGDGTKIKAMVSQREGYLPHLTQFNYLISNKFFGITSNGNNTVYNLDLVPDVSLSRTKIRGVIDCNYEIQRALEISSELLQIKQGWSGIPEGFLCTPLELYNDLKSKGYDWKILLNTRSWWCPLEYEDGQLPFLSTWDLLKMRKDEYRPYWMKNE